jgi:hypothetical protein
MIPSETHVVHVSVIVSSAQHMPEEHRIIDATGTKIDGQGRSYGTKSSIPNNMHDAA